jgi:hypothetical protein
MYGCLDDMELLIPIICVNNGMINLFYIPSHTMKRNNHYMFLMRELVIPY